MKSNPFTLGLLALSSSIAIGQVQTVTTRYMEYPHVVPGTVFKVDKAVDPQTGRVIFMKNGAAFSVDELRQWEGIESQARLGRIGHLSEELESRRAQMGNWEMVKIVINAKYPSFQYPDKTKNPEDVLIASSKAAAALPPLVGMEALELRYGLSGCERFGAGMAVCDANRSQLDGLKADADVGVVDAFHDNKGTSVPLSALSPSGYNPGPVPSGAGLGTHAATYEWGLNSTFIGCLGISATYDVSTTIEPWDIRHTQVVFKTLVYTAPSATFYHRKSMWFHGTDDVNYLINNGIQTVSMSQRRGGTTPVTSTDAEFLVMDDFAYRYPYPVYVNPSDNYGYQYEVNWQCYNAISVGNVRHTNQTTYEMADCTQARNPAPIYGGCVSGSGSTCPGDREMPYVVAPGLPYTGTDMTTTCLGGYGTIGCGTSYSVPVVNGLAADIIAADSRMSNWPEKVRVALMLTSQNVDGGEWSSATDGRDGAGAVSGSEAVAFASGHTAVDVGNTAVENGLAVGALYAADFNTRKRYYYRVPNPKPSGKHLRVVLTWDSNPIVGGTTNALSDVDLIVQNDGGTSGSYSWDGNVEVVDVAAANLTAGSSYSVDVSAAINRIPASGSRTNFSYFSVGWTWVKDHAN